MLTFDLFTARSNLLPHSFVWALYIYMGIMLRIHISDISSKDYDPVELKLDEEHPSRHKIAKTELIQTPSWLPQPPS